MALKIRLARLGAKKRPCYRLVIANSYAPRDGSFKEKVGFYNPLLDKNNEKYLVLEIDRIRYWLQVGAKPTKRVEKLISNIIT